jgi:deoxycytidine triphosphate deaminase
MENTHYIGRQGKESPALITLYVCLAFVILSLSFEEIQLPTNHAGFVRGRDAVS